VWRTGVKPKLLLKLKEPNFFSKPFILMSMHSASRIKNYKYQDTEEKGVLGIKLINNAKACGECRLLE